MSNTAIPKGTSNQDIEARRRIIEAHLNKIKGNSFKCPCLGGVPVLLIGRGISEISAHASKSYKSTLAAIRLPELIENSYFYKMYLPKENAQKKKFKFIFLYELHCKIENGYAKVMVGVREEAKFLQYCVTVK